MHTVDVQVIAQRNFVSRQRQLQVRESLDEPTEADPQLQPGEVLAKALMCAVTERQMMGAFLVTSSRSGFSTCFGVVYWYHHTLSGIFQAIIDSGLVVHRFQEFAHDIDSGYAGLLDIEARPPMSYLLGARKPGADV